MLLGKLFATAISVSKRHIACVEAKTVGSLLKLSDPVKAARVQGWARKVHKKGKWLFVHVSDGFTSDSLQVVVPRAVCTSVSVGSAVDVTGEWVKSQGAQQPMELLASEFLVVGPNTSGQFVAEDSNVMRNQLSFRPKSHAFTDVLRLRSRLLGLTHRYFTDKDFVYVDPPVVSTNDCEGAGQAFIVKAQGDEDFFDIDEVFLPVSSQLHLEAIVSSIPKVYTIGAAFRAEKSLSRQHLAEFRMLEAEFAFAYDVEQICNLVEKYTKFVVAALREDGSAMAMSDMVRRTFGEEGSDKPLMDCDMDKNFPRLRYSEAEAILLTKGETVLASGFNKQQEFALVNHCQAPVFITHHPSAQKPFYMTRTPDGEYAECFDFLTGLVGELAGGSMRETDVSKLRSRGCGASLDWYVGLREQGQPLTAGFGIGVERFMQALFGIVNIKDTVAFPRWFKHCQC